jgi:hypothetical protein
MEAKANVECIICMRQFVVPNKDAPMPKHPIIGEPRKPGIPYISCPKSGQKGRFLNIFL